MSLTQEEKNIVSYGDVFAIPFFALAIHYFYKIKNKNMTELILYIAAICAFIFDFYHSYKFLS